MSVCVCVCERTTLIYLCTNLQARVGEERLCDWRQHVPTPAAGSQRDLTHFPNMVGWHRNIHLQGDLSGRQWLPQCPPQSQVCTFAYCLPCLILMCVFFLLLIFMSERGHDGWMFSPLLCFIATLLSNPSNPLIFTMQDSRLGCFMLLFAASLVWFYFSSSICLSLTHTQTCTNRQLPHAPENPIAVLSTTEKRAINLTWAQPFDGNSPLIRYILEVSENSEWFIVLFHR